MTILDHLIATMPEAVNAQSSTGHTPFLLAFRLHNLQAAKALIDAGADQTACDFDGQNVLHHLLALIANKGTQQEFSYVPEPAIEKHYDRMRSLMDLLDPSLIPTLCTKQISAAREHSFTPLASWLYHFGTGNACLVAVTRILLDYGKSAQLEVIDSMGQTPLHQIVNRNSPPTSFTFYALAALLLDCRPELVVRENISGKTPLELAGNAALRAKCRYRKARREHGNQDWRKYSERFLLAHTPESSFMEQNPVDFDDFGGRQMAEGLLSGAFTPSSDGDLRIESLWRLLIETKATLDAKGRGKRKLTNSKEVFAVADMKKQSELRRRRKTPRGDGHLAETSHWLCMEREYGAMCAQFPGCTCRLCTLHPCTVSGPRPL